MKPPSGNLSVFIVMAEKTAPDASVVPVSVNTSIDDVEPQGFDAAATKKLLRKLDWHLIPFMSLIYL